MHNKKRRGSVAEKVKKPLFYDIIIIKRLIQGCNNYNVIRVLAEPRYNQVCGFKQAANLSGKKQTSTRIHEKWSTSERKRKTPPPFFLDWRTKLHQSINQSIKKIWFFKLWPYSLGWWNLSRSIPRRAHQHRVIKVIPAWWRNGNLIYMHVVFCWIRILARRTVQLF